MEILHTMMGILHTVHGDSPHCDGDSPHHHGDSPHCDGDSPHHHGDSPHCHGDSLHHHGDSPHHVGGVVDGHSQNLEIVAVSAESSESIMISALGCLLISSMMKANLRVFLSKKDSRSRKEVKWKYSQSKEHTRVM